MGVNWAAGLFKWKPHIRRNGETCTLSHLHPFRFDMRYEAMRGQPARVITVHVGFACHVFTQDVKDAGPNPELYSDDRETRAFDQERYQWSQLLRGIVISLEQRKCYFAGREHFVSVHLDGTPAGCEYRVFFSVRRRDAGSVELIVQSAYLGKLENSVLRQKKQMRFRVIVSKVLLKQPLVEAF